MRETSTSSWLQLKGRHPRRLAKTSCNQKVPVNIKYSFEDAEKKLSPMRTMKSNITLHEWDITKTLTREEIRHLFLACFFWMTKKEAFYALYHVNKYMKTRYCDMMNKLSNDFSEHAKTNKIPEEYRKECWNECYEALMQDLQKMNQKYEKLYNSYMRKKLIVASTFKLFLLIFRKIWCNCRKRNEAKWSKALKEKILNYK
ncbi:RAD protein [Plasmodium ovale curtisi]|nr:RAD protein [Plasmodium ovale curtisi]